jgi:hypothetical protein
MIDGDKYRVFHSEGGGTIPDGVKDSWHAAKELRNEVFCREEVRAVWIMRDNPSLGIRPELYGQTLRRRVK